LIVADPGLNRRCAVFASLNAGASEVVVYGHVTTGPVRRVPFDLVSTASHVGRYARLTPTPRNQVLPSVSATSLIFHVEA
jgi:hypothetical protein